MYGLLERVLEMMLVFGTVRTYVQTFIVTLVKQPMIIIEKKMETNNNISSLFIPKKKTIPMDCDSFTCSM